MAEIQLTAMQKMLISTLGIDFAEIEKMKTTAENFMLNAKMIAEKQTILETKLDMILERLQPTKGAQNDYGNNHIRNRQTDY